MSACPDCGAEVGQRHERGCDVALCKGCGTQALQCRVHRAMPTTVWRGQWPGEIEAAVRGVDLNELGLMHADGRVVWDVDTERMVEPLGREAEAERIVRGLATVGSPDDDGESCGVCGGFSLPFEGGPLVVHQPGCLHLAARRWVKAGPSDVPPA